MTGWKTRKITLTDTRTMRVLPTGGGGFIIIMGCSCCGHGLMVYPGSYISKCAWRGTQKELDHKYVDEIRSKIPV